MKTSAGSRQVVFQSGAGPRAARVSALIVEPANADLLFVLAHGAGAGMHHPFMEAFVQALARGEVATFRYEFPYMAAGSGRPDPPNVLEETVRSAVGEAAKLCPGLPLLAGGKSMGGRMTSMAQAREPLSGVQGLVFVGFPLHPVNKREIKRAEHLGRVQLPMLFLQGTRDALADLTLLKPVIEKLEDRATLRVVNDADHSFKVLKRSGRTDGSVLEELAEIIASWGRACLVRPGPTASIP